MFEGPEDSWRYRLHRTKEEERLRFKHLISPHREDGEVRCGFYVTMTISDDEIAACRSLSDVKLLLRGKRIVAEAELQQVISNWEVTH